MHRKGQEPAVKVSRGYPRKWSIALKQMVHSWLGLAIWGEENRAIKGPWYALLNCF